MCVCVHIITKNKVMYYPRRQTSATMAFLVNVLLETRRLYSYLFSFQYSISLSLSIYSWAGFILVFS